MSQCYARPKGLVKSVPKSKRNSADGASHDMKAIHKCEPPSFVTDSYYELNKFSTYVVEILNR